MAEESERTSPNSALAEEIVADLAAAGLIPESRRDEVESKLKEEGASQDDWNLWVDMATAPERREGEENE